MAGLTAFVFRIFVRLMSVNTTRSPFRFIIIIQETEFVEVSVFALTEEEAFPLCEGVLRCRVGVMEARL